MSGYSQDHISWLPICVCAVGVMNKQGSASQFYWTCVTLTGKFRLIYLLKLIPYINCMVTREANWDEPE